MNEMDALFPLPTGGRNADDMGLPAPIAPTADEALDRIERVYGTPMTQPVREELKALRHDVERHVAIAAVQAEELERMREELRRALAIAPSNAFAWQDRAIGAEMERDQYRHERDAYRDAMARINAPAITLAVMQPPPPIITPKSDFDWVRENDRLHQHIDRLEAIRTAASVLIYAAEEWECDGLGLFAQHGYWDELHDAMERADEADANGKEPVDDVR